MIIKVAPLRRVRTRVGGIGSPEGTAHNFTAERLETSVRASLARLRIALGTRPHARESEAPSMLAVTCSPAADESCLDVHLLTERLSRPVEGEAEQLQRFLEAL